VKLKFDKLLSNFAVKFYSRRYIKDVTTIVLSDLFVEPR